MVSTEAFLSLSRAEAQALGMADLPQVVLPHPVGTLTGEQIEGVADRALEQVVRALITSTDERRP
jgi:hypothetical protein